MSGPWIAAFAALWLAVVLEAVLFLGLLRRVWASVEGLVSSSGLETLMGGVPVGTTLPPFGLHTRTGSEISSEELFTEPQLVLFVDGGCGPCHALADQLAVLDNSLIDGVAVAVITSADSDADELGLPPHVTAYVQHNRRASNAFENRATPQVFLVDRGGVVRGSSIPGSVADLRRLVATSANGDQAIFALKSIQKGGEEWKRMHPRRIFRSKRKDRRAVRSSND